MKIVIVGCGRVGASAAEAYDRTGHDVIILGVPFRTRFGGEFAIGRTIPYVLQNAPCTVWVVREPMSEETAS